VRTDEAGADPVVHVWMVTRIEVFMLPLKRRKVLGGDR
jgi:hypothetical protein